MIHTRPDLSARATLWARAFESQYLFRLYHGATGTPQPLSAAQKRLSDDMVRYWTTFAHNGNRNSPETPFWPRYMAEPARHNWLSLRLPEPITTPRGEFAAEHQCDFWDKLRE